MVEDVAAAGSNPPDCAIGDVPSVVTKAPGGRIHPSSVRCLFAAGGAESKGRTNEGNEAWGEGLEAAGKEEDTSERLTGGAGGRVRRRRLAEVELGEAARCREEEVGGATTEGCRGYLRRERAERQYLLRGPTKIPSTGATAVSIHHTNPEARWQQGPQPARTNGFGAVVFQARGSG